MALVSVEHLVLFIASLLIAATVAGALIGVVDRGSNAVTQQSMALSDSIDTDITIISDRGSDAMYDSGDEQIRVLVKNTGETHLNPNSSRIDVLVNGDFVHPDDVTVTPVSSDGWAPQEVVLVKIDHGLDAGDHRVTIHVNRNSDTIQFRV